MESSGTPSGNKSKATSLVLDGDDAAAVDAIYAQTGRSASDLLREGLAEVSSFADLAEHVPHTHRKKVALWPEQVPLVERLAQEGRVAKADILRAVIRRRLALYQQSKQTTGGAPPG